MFFLFQQLIFRKVADVKKEKELAEKRKNDPPLELATDHPVRKLISRFRKISDSRSHPIPDVERIGNHTEKDDYNALQNSTKIISVSENSKPKGNAPHKAGIIKAKWTKFISAAAVEKNADDLIRVDSKQNKIPLNDLSLGKTPLEKETDPQKMNVRPMARWTNFQQPIQETPEDDAKSNLKKSDSTDSGILRSNHRLDKIGDSIHDGLSINQDNVEFSVSEQQILSALYDMRVEIKEEIDNLCKKMNHVDEQITEVLRFFSSLSTSSLPYQNKTSTNHTEYSPSKCINSLQTPVTLDNLSHDDHSKAYVESTGEEYDANQESSNIDTLTEPSHEMSVSPFAVSDSSSSSFQSSNISHGRNNGTPPRYLD